MSDPPKACPNCRNPCVPEDKYCSECGFLLPSGGDSSSDTLIGKTLPGGYRIVEFIAEGSMGRVYRAEQSTLGRSVAVKIMNSALLAHPKMVDRFRTEAKAASMLNHPNCMRVYDFGEMPDGPPYLVMELLLGKDLEVVLQDEPLLPITRVLDLTLQVLRALEEAHEQGIVHRDLKPANVFVLPQRGGGDLIKVVDFGLAKLKSAISGSTMTGLVCGTPQYMAPEQATASETDQRTDLYACGVMLFEMLAGRPPFLDDDPSDLLRKQVYDEPPRLTDLSPERAIPGIEGVLEMALAKKKEERFATATQFAEAIQELVSVRTGERSHSWVRTSLRSCTECGGLFSNSARFCGECGAAVPRDSLPFPAPNGHTSNPADALGKRRVSSSAPTITSTEHTPPPDELDASDAALHEASRTAADDSRERATPALGRKMFPDIVAFGESDPKPKVAKREGLPREEAPERDARKPIDRRAEEASEAPRSRNQDAVVRPPDVAKKRPNVEAQSGAGTNRLDPRRDHSTDRLAASTARATNEREEPAPSKREPTRRIPTRPSPQELAQRESEEAWSAGAYDEPDETPAALVLIEARAASRLRVGDVKRAVALLRRAIALVRSDVDRGDIDDPIGAMAMFTGKLGDALMTAGDHSEALAALSESLHLTVTGAERVRLLLQMSRAARSLGRESEATRHLEDAEREARSLERRQSERPRGDDRDSGVSYQRETRSSTAPRDPRNEPSGFKRTKRSV